ncbi:TadE/TadG family type IV pilus assembly protein [Pseudophaeobacter flagellatus]|uniref:TadE/TadG family type IV pilus assembly protein n=1 Tax=Pseudophaeobacter flagellatus TaxID=2899119 RepID=UPI001E564835|nr:pilus assembly protein [Pseudophaeobacter flagellatus]MCD9148629.1 pilus assembly protein [Pseudophaeobacter flagellatus]
MLNALIAQLRRFRHSTNGALTVEFVIYAPLLLWLFAAIYTYFDAFRQDAVNLKAAYTISDLVSRETAELNETYIDSMHEMSKLLIRADSSSSLRITVVRWDEADNRYYVDWSKVRGTAFIEWTDATISSVNENLPTVPDQERVILVETRNEVDPAFNVGLPSMNLNNFVFTRPRFAPQVLFADGKGNSNSHNDGSMKL